MRPTVDKLERIRDCSVKYSFTLWEYMFAVIGLIKNLTGQQLDRIRLGEEPNRILGREVTS